MRCLQDRLGGVAFPDEVGGPDPGVACLPDDRLRARGQSVPLLVDASRTSAREVEIVLFDHAQDDQVGTVVPGALDRFLGGFTRGRRQVDSQEDPRSARRGQFESCEQGVGIRRPCHGPSGPHWPGQAAREGWERATRCYRVAHAGRPGRRGNDRRRRRPRCRDPGHRQPAVRRRCPAGDRGPGPAARRGGLRGPRDRPRGMA